jgi:hypothetical protein
MESRKKLGYGRLKNLLKKTMKVCFVVGQKKVLTAKLGSGW